MGRKKGGGLIEERLIISMYDYTGEWAKPYIEAGYPVMLWDKKIEGDIISERFCKEVLCYSEFVYGILAAPPCTYFAGSGARWWPRIPPESLAEMTALVEWVLLIKNFCPNLVFWSLENPVGRLEKCVPQLKQFRRLLFNPCDYGDPYTKKTILWGEFNSSLPKTPVLPLFGSEMHTISGWNKEEQKTKRSATPKGFASAFFKANQ